MIKNLKFELGLYHTNCTVKWWGYFNPCGVITVAYNY